MLWREKWEVQERERVRVRRPRWRGKLSREEAYVEGEDKRLRMAIRGILQ